MATKRKYLSNRDITYKMLVDAGYSLDSEGRVLGKRGQPLSPSYVAGNYRSISLGFGDLGLCTGFRYHRAVWMLDNQQDIPAGHQIDHINRVPYDNRPENLQLMANHSEHMAKDRAGRRQCNTKEWTIVNVNWSRGSDKWRVQFIIDGKSRGSGLFDDFQEACNHRNKIAAELGRPVISQDEIDLALQAQVGGWL